ncbi:hypothetical protein GOD68_18165 [Sinorhizobium medicae]|nr:hypothetical protein [Sinorhizobium medicae]
MNFKLTPEAQQRADERQGWATSQRTIFSNMTDENLVASAKLYMANMTPLQFAPGEPVYDATMWHIILPELMRRIGRQA